MPLSTEMKRLAEAEIGVWAAETGARLNMTGRMADQVRTLSVEALFRRMTLKYPVEMTSYTVQDFRDNVHEDGDRINATKSGETITPDMFPEAGGDYDRYEEREDEDG